MQRQSKLIELLSNNSRESVLTDMYLCETRQTEQKKSISCKGLSLVIGSILGDLIGLKTDLCTSMTSIL